MVNESKENLDFRIKYKDTSGMIRYSESFTVQANKNSEFEGHVHYKEFEIYHFVKGDISFSVEGRRIAVKEGDMIIVAVGLIHRPIINRECTYHRRHILFHKDIFKRLNNADFDFYRMLMKRKFWYLDRDTVSSEGFDRMYDQLEDLIKQQTSYASFCGMVQLFAFLIKAQECSKEILNSDTYKYDERISDILKYIEEHLTEKLSYEILADAFYISPKHLYKFFKKETGFMLSDYINERRIIKAQSLLNANIAAGDVASAVGFQDYSVFYRNFFKRVGCPPSKFCDFVDFTDSKKPVTCDLATKCPDSDNRQR